MNVWELLINNKVLMAAIVGWTVAQVAKTIIHIITNKKFVAERLVGGGGMPSSHSATVCGMSTMALLEYGVGSVEFAFACIFSLVVMYDAMGVRRETGNQAKAINEMRDTFTLMFDPSQCDLSPDERLKELIGHTPLQVLIGAITGIVIGVLMYYFVY